MPSLAVVDFYLLSLEPTLLRRPRPLHAPNMANDPWPWLPVELHTHILSFLPATRDRADLSVKTLVSYSRANSYLRAAACQPGLWMRHYRARYTDCIAEREAQRREVAAGNWRELYYTRRGLDHKALALVDEIRRNPYGRHDNASLFAREYSFDAFDALELEAELPIPACFRSDAPGDTSTKDASEEEIPYVMSRRYWAKALIGIIARCHTIKTWARLFSTPDNENESVTFEEALAGLSAFFDESPRQISRMLDKFAEDCRDSLTDLHVQLDPKAADYDLAQLCVEIRKFLLRAGFENARSFGFYDLMNQFPHALMKEGHRQTIPMSKVFMFASIARRLGIQASPTNAPGKVLCHITSAEPDAHEMLLNVCTDSPPHVFMSRQTADMLQELGLAQDLSEDIVRPCRISTILQRAVTNIQIAVRWNQRMARSAHLERLSWCEYAWSTAMLLRMQEMRLTPSAMEAKPLDARAVFMDTLAPTLVLPFARSYLESRCKNTIDLDEEFMKVYRRSEAQQPIMFFVGQAVKHLTYEYLGCILGWHPVCWRSWPEEFKSGDEESQPFYWVLTADGRRLYVPQQDLTEAFDLGLCKQMLESRTTFSRYFEGIHEDKQQGRSRLLLSEELKTMYPEDEKVSEMWVARDLP